MAVFADIGEEPSAVYRHLDHLKTLGGPPIWVRSAGKLGDDLMHGRNSTGQRFASIPAFTKDDAGKVGMVRRQCTKEYKVEVVNKAIRRVREPFRDWTAFTAGVKAMSLGNSRIERPPLGRLRRASGEVAERGCIQTGLSSLAGKRNFTPS